jgi:hypothetical protein
MRSKDSLFSAAIGHPSAGTLFAIIIRQIGGRGDRYVTPLRPRSVDTAVPQKIDEVVTSAILPDRLNACRFVAGRLGHRARIAKKEK